MWCSDTRRRCAAGAYLVVIVIVGMRPRAGGIREVLAAFLNSMVNHVLLETLREVDK